MNYFEELNIVLNNLKFVLFKTYSYFVVTEKLKPLFQWVPLSLTYTQSGGQYKTPRSLRDVYFKGTKQKYFKIQNVTFVNKKGLLKKTRNLAKSIIWN